MSVEETNVSPVAVRKSAYGRVIRERGTRNLVLAAISVAIAWYLYSTIHTNLMLQKRWPPLSPSMTGLTVLGLRDKNRPGWVRKYVAVKSNEAWHIRRPDEDTEEEAGTDIPKDVGERPNNPAGTHGVVRGEVVSIEEVMQNCPTVLTGAHFTGARIDKKYEPFRDKNYWRIHLDLTEEGRSRYWQYSREHEGEKLVFVLNGEIVTCPEIKHMDIGTFTIDPIWVYEDVKKLADFINNQKH
jgi:hypothetical protein